MKIIQERDKCIGCGACVAVCPKFWQIENDNKSKLINSVINKKTDNYELETDKCECNQEAADNCPVSIIHIEK